MLLAAYENTCLNSLQSPYFKPRNHLLPIISALSLHIYPPTLPQPPHLPSTCSSCPPYPQPPLLYPSPPTTIPPSSTTSPIPSTSRTTSSTTIIPSPSSTTRTLTRNPLLPRLHLPPRPPLQHRQHIIQALTNPPRRICSIRSASVKFMRRCGFIRGREVDLRDRSGW